MALNEEFLTQDIDILPDATGEEISTTDILPEAAVEEAPAVEEPVQQTEQPATEPGVDSEIEALFASTAESSENVTEQIGEAGEKIEEVKEKIEEVQENPANLNTDELLKEIYQDLLQTETALSASKIAEEVAKSKVSELQAQVSGLEIDAAGQYQTDNPDLMIINKLINAAQGGSDVALPKVKDALNKIYLGLFNSTIEEGQVNDNLSASQDTGVTLNEGTLPTDNVEIPEEPTDINDITSILG